MAVHDEIPQPSELIYTPKPSWAAPALAVAIAFVVIGIFAEGFVVRGMVFMVAGGTAALIALRFLVLGAVREFYARPRRQRSTTAVLPAGSLRAPKKS